MCNQFHHLQLFSTYTRSGGKPVLCISVSHLQLFSTSLPFAGELLLRGFRLARYDALHETHRCCRLLQGPSMSHPLHTRIVGYKKSHRSQEGLQSHLQALCYQDVKRKHETGMCDNKTQEPRFAGCPSERAVRT